MNSIIDEMYSLLDLPKPLSDSERTKIRARLDPLMDQVQAHFGVAFVDELTGLHSDLCGNNDLREFRAGFITGARLMMEVLG